MDLKDSQGGKKKKKSFSLKVSVVVFSKGLQDDGDDGHDGFDHAELQRGLEETSDSESDTETGGQRKDVRVC